MAFIERDCSVSIKMVQDPQVFMSIMLNHAFYAVTRPFDCLCKMCMANKPCASCGRASSTPIKSSAASGYSPYCDSCAIVAALMRHGCRISTPEVLDAIEQLEGMADWLLGGSMGPAPTLGVLAKHIITRTRPGNRRTTYLTYLKAAAKLREREGLKINVRGR